VAKHNLAAIRGQSSALVLYQQSIATDNVLSTANQSVTLFDPTVSKKSSLPAKD